jgi:hypothetical protein
MHDNEKINIFDKVSRDNAAQRLSIEVNVKRSLVAVLLSMAFCLALFISAGLLPENFACIFYENNSLLYIWPPNGSIINSLDITNYTHRQKCEFIALRSIMSATLFPYLVYIISSQARSKEYYYRKGEMIPFVVILIIGAYTAFDPISPLQSKFHLSSTSSVSVNILKSGMTIYGMYFCLYMIFLRIFPFMRSNFK